MIKKQLKLYTIVTIGSLIFALAFDWFFVPNQVGLAGVTGLAQVVNALVPLAPVGVAAFALNIPLFLAGWRFLGRHMLISSLFSMAVSSLAIDAIAAFHTFAPMDPMLASLCGGAMMGLGLGMVFTQGATTGGTDVVARLLKLKFPWLPLGKLLLIPDFVVLLLVAVAFGRMEPALYGLVSLFVSTKVMDTVLYGLDTSKVAYVISDRWREIADSILDFDRGVTLLHAEGAFTGLEKRVLLVAFKQKQIVQIKHTVHDVDAGAFLIVCDAHDVLGEGFGEYRKEEL
ncbi:MAG: YitT family protein [Oscillibacter sp.]